jgi:Asp-tRNA(Asn)/Glu-tRNA(Gln) amidotransferase C subunit
MSTKEKQEKLLENMKRWQKLENAAIAQTSKIMAESDHPLIRTVAEVIQRDSHMHYRVQQLIIDSLEKESVPMLIDQLESIWGTIEQHIQVEKNTIEMATASLDAISGSRNVIQQYLLNYLLEDEKKHDKLLADLELIKKKMFP